MKFNFELSPEQEEKFNKWKAGTEPFRYAGAIGGRYTYSFTPNSLGTVIKVTDSMTKKEIDLSDYENW